MSYSVTVQWDNYTSKGSMDFFLATVWEKLDQAEEIVNILNDMLCMLLYFIRVILQGKFIFPVGFLFMFNLDSCYWVMRYFDLFFCGRRIKAL